MMRGCKLGLDAEVRRFKKLGNDKTIIRPACRDLVRRAKSAWHVLPSAQQHLLIGESKHDADMNGIPLTRPEKDCMHNGDLLFGVRNKHVLFIQQLDT